MGKRLDARGGARLRQGVSSPAAHPSQNEGGTRVTWASRLRNPPVAQIAGSAGWLRLREIRWSPHRNNRHMILECPG